MFSTIFLAERNTFASSMSQMFSNQTRKCHSKEVSGQQSPRERERVTENLLLKIMCKEKWDSLQPNHEKYDKDSITYCVIY